MTNNIEVFKLVKLGSQNNTDNIEKEYDERNWLDIVDDKESDERDQIGEIKEDDLESEELETDERYQIEIPESLKRIDIQQNIENHDLVNTFIDLETNVVKNTELSTSESVSRKITETLDENVDA